MRLRSLRPFTQSTTLAALTLSITFAAHAQMEPVTGAEPAPAVEPPPAKPKPPPYSLPFQLRPVVAGNVIRSDTAFAFYKAPSQSASGTAIATTLLASYKVTDELAPLVRVGLVSNSPAANPPEGAASLMNPVLGALYALKLSPDVRLALFLGVTLPLGGGGGDTPDPAKQAANNAGIRARSAMDNAMFATNDLTVFPGVGFAYVNHGFTAQVEATVLQLTRVRGADKQPDSSRTNFTSGLHVGYFVRPLLSLGVELRHQRFLSTPKAVEANESLRDTTTFALGPRFHIELGDKLWLRPAVAFAMGLDNPLKESKYRVVQLDVPFAF